MNPEFRRNLWLELSLHRLIAAPAVILLVLVLFVAANPQEAAARVAIAAALAAFLLLTVWGASSAGDAIPEEIRGRTWDSQRMSAIGPWAMTWGKLFGTTAFAWYGGALCLAVLVLAAPPSWPRSALEIALLIAALAVLAQGFACLGGLTLARKGSAKHSSISGWLLVLALVFFGPGVSLFSEGSAAVAWWGGAFELLRFTLLSAAVFGAWAVFALYRAMCTELQVRTTPWAFAAFAVFLTVYLAGFAVREGAGHAWGALLGCGIVVSAALTYLFLFAEQTGAMVFRRIQLRAAQRDAYGALAEMPCWIVGIALAAAFSVAALIPARAPAGLFGEASRAPLALLFLLARDAAIFLFFAFARAPRRVETATIFYLVLLYGVVPWLLAAAGLKGAAELVLPPVFERPIFATLVAAAQCGIACTLAAWRWRRLRQSMEST